MNLKCCCRAFSEPKRCVQCGHCTRPSTFRPTLVRLPSPDIASLLTSMPVDGAGFCAAVAPVCAVSVRKKRALSLYTSPSKGCCSSGKGAKAAEYSFCRRSCQPGLGSWPSTVRWRRSLSQACFKFGSTRVGCSNQMALAPGTSCTFTRNHGLFIMPMRFQVGHCGWQFWESSQQRTANSKQLRRSRTGTSTVQCTQQYTMPNSLGLSKRWISAGRQVWPSLSVTSRRWMGRPAPL
mmetsp:Transcript_4410/g.13484  ORF Transcript_4410/g.13484 Transcript_4410/m.13484 type:complete len:236 (+) Transcript_4410:428-1135(+)